MATVVWGVAGLAVGLYIAFQLAFPVLNLGIEYTSFGRLRPLHTSAVVFAFGGNALIATSFYVVQRTCRARLAFPTAARFVFWGYQLFLVLAATGYVMGVTERSEEHTSELQSLMRISYAVFCLKKKNTQTTR